MKKTRRIPVYVASGMLALTLGMYGCGAATSSASITDSTEGSETAQTAGGWETSEAPNYLTSEEQQIFDAAVKGTPSEGLKPVAVLATQVVAGTNYAYLCQSEGANPAWHIAVVYNDLEGNATLSGVNDLDLLALQTSNESNAGLVGAWEVCSPAQATGLPQRAASAFSDAAANYDGVTFTPVALLSTQVVAGTNYRILCVGTTTGDKPTDGLYVLTIYQDLEGHAEITSAEQLDLNAYVTVTADE